MTLPPKPIIAIDGPAASGKGSLARQLAEQLNFAYMDTGILYRGVGLEVINADLDLNNHDDCIKAAKTLLKNIQSTTLNNPRLRDDDIGQAASIVAAIPEVRDTLNDLQRNFAKNPGESTNGAILDGRDIGTIICPDADLKLFVTAKIEIRAQRRLKDLQSKGITVKYDTVLDNMRTRDSRDAQRKDAPLTRAKDAIIIDNSDLSAEETLEMALKITKERLNL